MPLVDVKKFPGLTQEVLSKILTQFYQSGDDAHIESVPSSEEEAEAEADPELEPQPGPGPEEVNEVSAPAVEETQVQVGDDKVNEDVMMEEREEQMKERKKGPKPHRASTITYEEIDEDDDDEPRVRIRTKPSARPSNPTASSHTAPSDSQPTHRKLVFKVPSTSKPSAPPKAPSAPKPSAPPKAPLALRPPVPPRASSSFKPSASLKASSVTKSRAASLAKAQSDDDDNSDEDNDDQDNDDDDDDDDNDNDDDVRIIRIKRKAKLAIKAGSGEHNPKCKRCAQKGLSCLVGYATGRGACLTCRRAKAGCSLTKTEIERAERALDQEGRVAREALRADSRLGHMFMLYDNMTSIKMEGLSLSARESEARLTQVVSEMESQRAQVASEMKRLEDNFHLLNRQYETWQRDNQSLQLFMVDCLTRAAPMTNWPSHFDTVHLGQRGQTSPSLPSLPQSPPPPPPSTFSFSAPPGAAGVTPLHPPTARGASHGAKIGPPGVRKRRRDGGGFTSVPGYASESSSTAVKLPNAPLDGDDSMQVEESAGGGGA